MDSLLFYSGLALILIAWTAYLAVIPTEKVPERPIAHNVAMGLGVLLMVIGFLQPLLTGSSTSIGRVIALLTVGGFGLLYFYLLSIAGLPDGELGVSIGAPLIAFEAVDSTGQPVSTSEWEGKRTLLKFFRGRW